MIRASRPALLLTLALSTPLACAHLNHPEPQDARPVTRSVPSASASSSLRIATYNVHMESAAAIARAISDNRRLRAADVIVLQEIEAHEREGKSRAEQIADELEMSFAYAPGYGLRSGGSHGVAILSRFALRNVRSIELPYHHVVVNSARRAALATTIRLAGEDVRVYGVHLDNRINPQERKRQLEPVLEAADAFDGPIIIAGDLNTTPFCWLGSLVPIPCGLQDDAIESGTRGHGLQSPAARSGATSKWLAMKLDGIYVRGFAAQASAVERSVRLSDHLPLWMDLRLDRDGGGKPIAATR